MPPKQPADAAKAPKVKGIAKTKDAAIKENKTLFNSTPKSFAIGNCVQPVRNLSRYVKWPKYVRLQRQRAVLYDRLKTPPSIAQFTRTLDKASAAELFKMLDKYAGPLFSLLYHLSRACLCRSLKKTSLSLLPSHVVQGTSPKPSRTRTSVLRASLTALPLARRPTPARRCSSMPNLRLIRSFSMVQCQLTPSFSLQPLVLKFGINHITDLVENRTAKLVRCSRYVAIVFSAA
jgi:hypothetical protein